MVRHALATAARQYSGDPMGSGSCPILEIRSPEHEAERDSFVTKSSRNYDRTRMMQLDTKALSMIAAGLKQLENAWRSQRDSSSDEDEISDLTNDILYAESLRSEIERRLEQR
jgi:hypothetical protein